MPQIDYFAEAADEKALVEIFLNEGFQIIPDLNYDAPGKVMSISDWAGYERVRLETTLFFLFSERTCLSPLETHQVSGTGWRAGKYVVTQRVGGPTLKFLCYRPFERNGRLWIPSGFVSYYATHKNTITGNLERIVPELRLKYHSISKFVRQRARLIEQPCVGGGVRKYWIMKAAQEALKGGACLGVDGLESIQVSDPPDLLE